jgi:hypothetical protein
MKILRKDMPTKPKPGLPAHLQHLTKSALAAADAAKTPAEKAVAACQGRQAMAALEKYKIDALFKAALLSAPRKSLFEESKR